MADRHAILSPSAAYRWLACTPSARFEEQIPEEENLYAAEGTLAHELAAVLLLEKTGGRVDDDTLKAIKANPLYSSEMQEYCEGYASFVAGLARGVHVYIEHEYDMSKYIPLQFGTCDASFIKGSEIWVVDFKYGAGVSVSPTANKQMMCYALGVYDYHSKGYSLKGANLLIYQPRASSKSEYNPKPWYISVEDLLRWAETEAKPKGRLAIAGMGDFVPGQHCQFCKAITLCKACYDRFSDVKKIKDKRAMTDTDIATVLTYGPLIASWVKKVEEDTVKRLENGNSLKGFKLVAGRGRRAFKNEDDVVDILIGEGYEDQIFDSSLKSLTAIEKLMGPKRFKEIFADEVMTIPGKVQIAPVDDDRPAVGASAADEYDDEYDELL
ncbi:DUF2800 domain-containing protein [Bacteroides nordii]|uniref:PD-(D/E)XK endonuclease-like domain-containing protein n=1 Tax=Bacteroides nordii CL02T12C05 TaxID=997884 RepID=I8XD51_9BACE|nr:DUF2800 domain-containing protein [Bacteroides nordii]EIY48022.1 hypothetical protein HMPREF1068_03101 [Bacteroides nordii CL02T12C05]MCG4768934.1 DUF2800 domain-containing protein [Bacteroides nordii]